MKALTDSELAAIVNQAIGAERAACAAECIRIGERAKTIREKSVALACFAAITERGFENLGQSRRLDPDLQALIDAAVSKPDTRPS